jgi:hypothetical protein
MCFTHGPRQDTLASDHIDILNMYRLLGVLLPAKRATGRTPGGRQKRTRVRKKVIFANNFPNGKGLEQGLHRYHRFRYFPSLIISSRLLFDLLLFNLLLRNHPMARCVPRLLCLMVCYPCNSYPFIPTQDYLVQTVWLPGSQG